MFSKLELEHSLYDIDENKLLEFKKIAKEVDLPDSPILNDGRVHNRLDNYAIVLNIWLFIRENKESLYFNPDKMMPYASNFYTFEQLRRDQALKRFLHKVSFNEQYEFEFAYYLSEQLLIWVFEVLKNSDSTVEIMEENKQRDYFKMVDELDISMDTSHPLYLDQKYVTQRLAQNISMTNDFSTVILKAINNTRNYINLNN